MSSELPLTPPVLCVNTPSTASQSPQDQSTVTSLSVHGQHVATIPRSPARSHSPRDLVRAPSVPPNCFGTPPILESQRASASSPRPEDFTARSSRSTTKITIPVSPFDNQSQPTLSPCLASPSSSFLSSDTGRSPCSTETGSLLSPPLAQPDGDKPPYKPHRKNSESLTMAKPRRARTEPNNKHDKKRRQRHRHNCNKRKSKLEENQIRGDWRIPGCQVAPTAPFGSKALCGFHDITHTPREDVHGNVDSSRKCRIMSLPARPVVSRRWSSVEIGAHQVSLKSKFPKGATISERSLCRNGSALFNPESVSYRYRSSTFTSSVIDHDIVRTVRERLTVRKAPIVQLESPATITLRRASRCSMQSGVSGNNTKTATIPLTGESTTMQFPRLYSHEKSPTEYIITSRDIDSITELIEANIRRNDQPRPRTEDHSSTFTPSFTNPRTRSLSITKKGLIVQNSSPAENTTTVAEAQRSYTKPQTFSDHLQVVPQTRKKSGLPSRNQSRKSIEVIWEGGISAEDEGLTSIMEDDDGKDWSTSDDSPRQCTPSPKPGAVPNVKPVYSRELRTDASDAFDPKNANASIDEWLWGCPPGDAPVVILSGSESTEKSPVSEAPSNMQSKEVIKPPEIKNEEIEVFSFPPLPARKKTSDWHSPLPDITTSPVLSHSRSLYDLGVDACTGSYTSKIASQSTSEPTWLGVSEDSKPIGMDFKTNDVSRRKSVIKVHPNAPIRPGDPTSMGSAIGVATGVRRKSSGLSPKVIRHVCTIDNVEKGKRQGIWTKFRQDSSCPSPKPPSPEQDDETDNDFSWSTDTSRPQSRAGLRPSQVDERANSLSASTDPSRRSSRVALMRSSLSEEKKNNFSGPSRPSSRGTALRSGVVDRMALIRDKSPPLPTMDHVGIFGRITGSKGKLDPCLEGCTLHVCDDCAKDPRTPDVDWIG